MDEGRLARARGAEQQNTLTRLDGEVKISNGPRRSTGMPPSPATRLDGGWG
jgi:hypothetical protein